MEGDGVDQIGMVGEGFHFFPGLGVVDVDLLVPRPGGEQWLGRVEGDAVESIGMIGEGFDDGPVVGVVDVNFRVPRSGGEQ